jgi:hypothetical protein
MLEIIKNIQEFVNNPPILTDIAQIIQGLPLIINVIIEAIIAEIFVVHITFVIPWIYKKVG